MISEKKKKKKLQWHLSNSGKLKLQCRSTMRAQQCAIKAECRHQEGFVLNAYHLQRKTCNARLLLNTPLFTNQAVALKSDHVTAQHFYYEYSFLHDAFAHFGKQKHWFYRFNFTLKKTSNVLIRVWLLQRRSVLHDQFKADFLKNRSQKICGCIFFFCIKYQRFTSRLNPRSINSRSSKVNRVGSFILDFLSYAGPLLIKRFVY